MILQIITFPVLGQISSVKVLADARATVARCQAEGELVWKVFSHRGDGALIGTYLRKSRARAEETHGPDW